MHFSFGLTGGYEDGALKAALSCGIWIVMGIIHSFS